MGLPNRHANQGDGVHRWIDPAVAIPLVGGAVAGAVVAAIIAVNLVIIAGPDSGYESSPADVFEHSWLLGVITAAILVAGPVIGAILGLKRHGPNR